MAPATHQNITAAPLLHRPDPIFARIEAHRAAKQAHSDTCAYEDDFPDEITRKPRVDAHAGVSAIPHYLNTETEIRDFIKQRGSWWGTKNKLTGMRVRLLRALRADTVSIKKARDKAGYTAAEEAYKAASAAEMKTYKSLLNTMPTSAAGVVALADYIAENERVWLDREEGSACFKALKTVAKWAERLKASSTH